MKMLEEEVEVRIKFKAIIETRINIIMFSKMVVIIIKKMIGRLTRIGSSKILIMDTITTEITNQKIMLGSKI
jgi:hypothetical protein